MDQADGFPSLASLMKQCTWVHEDAPCANAYHQCVSDFNVGLLWCLMLFELKKQIMGYRLKMDLDQYLAMVL